MKRLNIEWSRYTDAVEMMCEKYCKWTLEPISQEELDDICENCPINNLHIDEYWKEKNEYI